MGCIPNGICLEKYAYSGNFHSTEYKCNEDGTVSTIVYDQYDCNATNDNYVSDTYDANADTEVTELASVRCSGSCNGYVKWTEYESMTGTGGGCSKKISNADHEQFVAPLGCTNFEEDGTSVRWFCFQSWDMDNRLKFGYEMYVSADCQGNYTQIVTHRGGACSTGYGTGDYSYVIGSL